MHRATWCIATGHSPSEINQGFSREPATYIAERAFLASGVGFMNRVHVQLLHSRLEECAPPRSGAMDPWWPPHGDQPRKQKHTWSSVGFSSWPPRALLEPRHPCEQSATPRLKPLPSRKKYATKQHPGILVIQLFGYSFLVPHGWLVIGCPKRHHQMDPLAALHR